MTEVVEFPKRRSSENPDDVLELAVGEYKELVILGYDKDDRLDFRATQFFAKKSEILFILEQFKMLVMSGAFDAD